MEKLYTFKTTLKMAGRGCTPLILPPRSVPSHKLQKPSKEYGIFQLLGTINVVLVYIKGKVKRGGGGMAQCPPKYATSTGRVANVNGDIAQASFSIISLPISILGFAKTFSGA